MAPLRSGHARRPAGHRRFDWGTGGRGAGSGRSQSAKRSVRWPTTAPAGNASDADYRGSCAASAAQDSSPGAALPISGMTVTPVGRSEPCKGSGLPASGRSAFSNTAPDDARAEVMLPQPVDQHPGGQRVARPRHPAREGEPTARRRFAVGRRNLETLAFGRRDGQVAWLDRVLGLAIVAAMKDLRGRHRARHLVRSNARPTCWSCSITS